MQKALPEEPVLTCLRARDPEQQSRPGFSTTLLALTTFEAPFLASLRFFRPRQCRTATTTYIYRHDYRFFGARRDGGVRFVVAPAAAQSKRRWHPKRISIAPGSSKRIVGQQCASRRNNKPHLCSSTCQLLKENTGSRDKSGCRQKATSPINSNNGVLPVRCLASTSSPRQGRNYFTISAPLRADGPYKWGEKSQKLTAQPLGWTATKLLFSSRRGSNPT
ncbi:hypothetical protein MAPG_10258 [Magnaporthiopsis poae ATCC 64411]|uniref:Uncharacterized protein n=1 Tax=Magnaporthiopsis poae (strain ATCC 64411 / 73-15) TaxID=644358 RepID=A0A0C4EC44_MAGP6|nr:hypothetical protein MAPG_10258 [Magnaporthiopsis poae ATCC 64411]